MVGRDDACEAAWMGAHHAWLRRGETERAARCAFWQALGLFFFQGDADAAYPSFVEAGAIAERFGDSDATMFARLGRGYSLILQGRIAIGTKLNQPGSTNEPANSEV
jgi:hypothetical protein